MVAWDLQHIYLPEQYSSYFPSEAMCVRFCARTPGIMHVMPIQDSVMGKSPSKPRYWSPLADTCVLNPAYRIPWQKWQSKTAEISRY